VEGHGKIGVYRATYCFISETIQNTAIVTMECK